jgi:hypothetical protein
MKYIRSSQCTPAMARAGVIYPMGGNPPSRTHGGWAANWHPEEEFLEQYAHAREGDCPSLSKRFQWCTFVTSNVVANVL